MDSGGHVSAPAEWDYIIEFQLSPTHSQLNTMYLFHSFNNIWSRAILLIALFSGVGVSFAPVVHGQNGSLVKEERARARDLGIKPGVLQTGPLNAITDVDGVLVGHTTLIVGDSIRTGVTAILPHSGNIYSSKVPAGFFQGNGYGKFAGSTQIIELGEIETPIVLTNTLSVPQGMEGVISWTLAQKGNENVRSVNAVVGETNDGFLNDIRGRHVLAEHVWETISKAASGPVEEGSVGAGTGTVSFGWKGGIGTSSRQLPASLGSYTVGALVQTNYGGILQVDGVPVGEELGQYYLKRELDEGDADGSVIIVLATDAPLSDRNLSRLAARAMLAVGKSGSPATNGSGDYAVAFSTSLSVRRGEGAKPHVELGNEAVSPLFQAAVEATEEAIYNALFTAQTVKGHGGTVKAIDLDEVIRVMRKYGRDVNFVR
jgi:D-aminopeptidase